MTIKNRSQNKYVFGILAIGFTAISVWNGFHFYNILFGISLALLISIVFEVARLSCLFSLVHRKGKFSFFTALIYILVAGLCVFASINSFSTDVAYQNKINQKKFESQVHNIKKLYSEKVDKQLSGLDRDINYLENQVAKYQKSDYWEVRLSQIINNRDELVTERDRFLNETPEDYEKWVKTNSALMGVKFKILKSRNEKIESVNYVLKDLWGFDKNTGRNFIGIALTIVIELSILLLSFLSANPDPKEYTEKISEVILEKFDRNKVQKFIELNRACFSENGRLLPQNKLSASLRPIRDHLSSYNNRELGEIFK